MEGAAQLLAATFPDLAGVLETFVRTRAEVQGAWVQGTRRPLVMDIVPVVKEDVFLGGICSFHDQYCGDGAMNSSVDRRLETIIDSSSDGIWVCDGSGTILSINRASEKLNGIQAGRVVGRNIEDLLANKVFDKSVTTQVLQSGRQETVMQYVAKTKKYLLSTGTPSLDDMGNISIIVVNERDMTELNTLRRKFEQSQKIKEKYKEELSELALLELEQNSFIAESDEMRKIVQMSLKLAHIGASNILILGESGTGKSMLSKLIHKNSIRKKNPFVEINCAALPEHLLEAELFGYEKGAFTGASSNGKIGLFEMAQGGTLFLDEIGDMPLALQAKLLKYLDNYEIRRIGGREQIRVECSVVAATNQNLQELVGQKLFREDLYYRLNSFILNVPPLRERPRDVSALIRHYLNKFNEKYDCNKTISTGTIKLLTDYTYPGNTRELKSILENGVVMADHHQVDEYLLMSIGHSEYSTVNDEHMHHDYTRFNLADTLREVEKKLLMQAKKEFGTTREMAKKLCISQPSVVRKLKVHNIQ